MREACEATIIIPQHGRTELTRAAVDSIRRSEQRGRPILIVDDGSPADDAPDELTESWGGVEVFRQPHRGVTAAWNAALGVIETPYALFLNNDVIATGAFLDRMLTPLRTGRAALTGASWRTETLLPDALHRRLPSVRFLQGWCFAAAAERLRDLGGFDERMRLYWSDTDLQLRLIVSEGGQRDSRIAVDDLPLIHLGHKTAHALRGRRQQWQCDRDVFLRKWGERFSAGFRE